MISEFDFQASDVFRSLTVQWFPHTREVKCELIRILKTYSKDSGTLREDFVSWVKWLVPEALAFCRCAVPWPCFPWRLQLFQRVPWQWLRTSSWGRATVVSSSGCWQSFFHLSLSSAFSPVPQNNKINTMSYLLPVIAISGNKGGKRGATPE